MRAYAVRRLLMVIPTLFLVTVLVFLSVRFLPGDVIDVMEARLQATQGATGGDRPRRPRAPARIGCAGLRPVWALGGRDIPARHPRAPSLTGSDTVEQSIAERLPVTVQLGLMAIVIGLVIAVPVGIYSANRQDTAADYVGRSLAILGLATPNFWLATMVIVFPAIWWRWSPPLVLVSFAEDPLGSLAGFAVPSLILGTYLSAATMRMTRTMMLEVLRQDYIRTAWSKGLLERAVILRHAVKNALIPVVSLVALQVPILVGGSVIMENIFNLPGLGRLLVNALSIRDYPIVSGVNLVFGTVVVAVNLVTDLSYALIDPRVRYR